MKMKLFKGALVKTTEVMVIENGRCRLSAAELKERIAGKTIRGDYYVGREYVSYIDEDGTVDGTNDLGTYCVGKWSVDDGEDTLTVEWNCSWDNWTGRAYDVDGTIQFYDCTAGLWRTTFKLFADGRVSLEV